MKMDCWDVFKDYNLPFETYFSRCVHHESTTHDELELIWLIKGEAVIFCEETEFHLTDQTLFMIYMHREHSVKTSDGSILISYRFKKEHLKINNLLFESIPFKHRVYTFQELIDKYHAVPLLISQLLKLLLSNTPPHIVRYKIIGYYNFFMYDLNRMLLKERYLDIKKRDSYPFLMRVHTVIEYIYTNAHRKIFLEELSKVTNLSTYRISHFMKEYLGVSFSEFLQITRFEYALKLLMNSDISIQEVVRQSGFSDVKYLNQMMKDRFHMTALKYRRIMTCQNNEKSQPFHMTDFIDELRMCLQEIETYPSFSNHYRTIIIK